MTRRHYRPTLAERHALWLQTFGDTPTQRGYLDGYDILPPRVLDTPAAQAAYDAGYGAGQRVRREALRRRGVEA